MKGKVWGKVVLREEWLWVHLHEGKGLGKSGLKRGVVLYMKGKVWGKVVLREELSLLVHLHEAKGGLKRGVVLTSSFT